MSQKKFFIKSSNSVLNCLKELSLALYYKPYIRCNILDGVFILDDGYSLNHIKSSFLFEESVGRSFLSTRIVYRHKNVPSLKLNSFLNYHFSDGKNVAATIVSNLKLHLHRDVKFGSKMFVVISARKGGFHCYSGGFLGFLPSSHYKEALFHFISHLIVTNRPKILTFCFTKGSFNVFAIGSDPEDLAAFVNQSKYFVFCVYSFFRVGLLMGSASFKCSRTFNNFSKPRAKKNSNVDLSIVFLSHTTKYTGLEEEYEVLKENVYFSSLSLQHVERRSFLGIKKNNPKYRDLDVSKLRSKMYKEFNTLILRQTNYEKIKGLVEEKIILSCDFLVSENCLTSHEMRIKDFFFKYIHAFDFHESTLNSLKNELLKKNRLTSLPKIEDGSVHSFFIAKIETSDFDDLFIKNNRRFFYLDFLFTSQLRKSLGLKQLTQKTLERLLLRSFSSAFLTSALIAKYNINNHATKR